MGYDASKVNWTADEHAAAENADKIYETLRPALADGFQAHDTAAGLAVARPGYEVWAYLVGSAKDKAEFARKLIALGVMLERDNHFIG
jgi:hypothetical protein